MVSHPSPLLSRSHRAFSHRGMFASSERFARFFNFSTLSAVWSECPYEGGYDFTLGTSEHGTPVDSTAVPSFQHLLLVFGGVEGLEPAIAADEELSACGADPSSIFDRYLNLCPVQGSRTIRTEEALLIGMAALQPHIAGAQAP